jgi:8-oxo-dGTP diphosphatase
MMDGIQVRAKELRCKPDDIMDEVCLAVSAVLKAHGMCDTIPEEPEMDARGLVMQMVVPKVG